MNIVNLIYVSTAINANVTKIEDILSESQTNNAKISITGILYYNSQYFLQCLEGERKNVNVLYNKIIQDPRHTNPMLLHYGVITERRYSDWNMSYVGNKVIEQHNFLKYLVHKDFNPYDMSGETSALLLEELAVFTE